MIEVIVLSQPLKLDRNLLKATEYNKQQTFRYRINLNILLKKEYVVVEILVSPPDIIIEFNQSFPFKIGDVRDEIPFTSRPKFSSCEWRECGEAMCI